MKTLKFILIVSIIILSQKMVFAKDIKVPGVYISSSEEHDLLGTSTLKITCAMVSTSACYTISTGMAINTDFDPLKQHGELEIENQYNSIYIESEKITIKGKFISHNQYNEYSATGGISRVHVLKYN